jgi:hypothetical protein
MKKEEIAAIVAENDELISKKYAIVTREKELAMKILKEHFNGDCTFLTEEEFDAEEFGGCPTIMSTTMVRDRDPADAAITRVRVGSKKDWRTGEEKETLYFDIYAYYLGEKAENVDAEDESPIEWSELLCCLLAAAESDN